MTPLRKLRSTVPPAFYSVIRLAERRCTSSKTQHSTSQQLTITLSMDKIRPRDKVCQEAHLVRKLGSWIITSDRRLICVGRPLHHHIRDRVVGAGQGASVFASWLILHFALYSLQIWIAGENAKAVSCRLLCVRRITTQHIEDSEILIGCRNVREKGNSPLQCRNGFQVLTGAI